MATFSTLSVVPWILFAQSSWNMDAVPVIAAPQSHGDGAAVVIKDRGGIFGRAAELRAEEALRRIHHRHRVPVLIESVRSLKGAWVADVARRRDAMAGPDRLYILVAGEERDVGVMAASRGPASRLTDRERESIRRAFLGPLQAGKPDEAIEEGVRAIGTTFDSATSGPGPVVRNALISAAILFSAAAALIASQVWARLRRRQAGASAPDLDQPPASTSANLLT